MWPVWCGLSASGICRSCISWDRVEGAAKAKSSGTASSWATLVKRVFEVDPLQCPQCGSRMKVVSFIERCQRDVVEKILRHCGLWEGPLRTLATARSPPNAADSDRDASTPVGPRSRVPLASILAARKQAWGSWSLGVRTDQVVATPGLPKEGAYSRENYPILVCEGSAQLFGAVRRKSRPGSFKKPPGLPRDVAKGKKRKSKTGPSGA